MKTVEPFLNLFVLQSKSNISTFRSEVIICKIIQQTREPIFFLEDFGDIDKEMVIYFKSKHCRCRELNCYIDKKGAASMKTFLFYRILGMIKNIGADWDKLAPGEENAIDFAHIYINPEPDRKIDSNHFSCEYCLAHNGESLNEHLREDRTNKEDIDISDMVARHSCKTDLVLYRGVCDYAYDLMLQNAVPFEGVELYEKGYMQCSLVKGHELNRKTKLRIFVPAGSCVIYLGNVNNEQDFYEVDIQHGAKLKLISIDQTYINCKLLSTE